jgi:chromosome segregation ATPase
VIALQVKIKDFVQQNSEAEEQVRNIKEKYATELNEKEKITHALSASETKCRSLEEDVQRLESSSADWQKKVLEMKNKLESLENEREEESEKLTELTAEIKKNEEEIGTLRKQVAQNENNLKVHCMARILKCFYYCRRLTSL